MGQSSALAAVGQYLPAGQADSIFTPWAQYLPSPAHATHFREFVEDFFPTGHSILYAESAEMSLLEFSFAASFFATAS
jgi:hypothetical protein